MPAPCAHTNFTDSEANFRYLDDNQLFESNGAWMRDCAAEGMECTEYSYTIRKGIVWKASGCKVGIRTPINPEG